VCSTCSDVISVWCTRYVCKSLCKFQMCENCFLDEETHIHPLEEISGDNEEDVLFSYQDKITGNTLFLGQVQTALPYSLTIMEHQIKSVLSVIDIESDPKKERNKTKMALRNVYYPPDKQSYYRTILHQDILYHHINLPDFANPDLVFDKHYSIPHLFGESISFINSAIEKGNVLVHCERGQYRSPTVYIAWLINRGMNTSEAISLIGEGYEGWADKYWKNRPLYIDKLRVFEKKKNIIISYWSKKNTDLMSTWNMDRKISEKNSELNLKVPPKRDSVEENINQNDEKDNESIPEKNSELNQKVPPKRKRDSVEENINDEKDNESLSEKNLEPSQKAPPKRKRDYVEENISQNEDKDIVSLVPPKRKRDNVEENSNQNDKDNESLVPPKRKRDSVEENSNQNDNDLDDSVFTFKQKLRSLNRLANILT